MKRAVVSGTGEMGRLVTGTLEAEPSVEIVGVLEPLAGQAAPQRERYRSSSGADYPLADDPEALFRATRPDLVVDFTNAQATPRLIDAVLASGVRPVIGTSGVPQEEVARLRSGLAAHRLGGVIAANFALGAVVQMHLARIAARFFDAAEVIELHHDRKADSPSGTALATARGMREARDSDFSHPDPELEHEGAEGARGAELGGVGIHSVRLPGLVAHQEVILGGRGQTLSLRHDTTGRESFMPGVLLAVHAVMGLDGLVEGLDSLIGLS